MIHIPSTQVEQFDAISKKLSCHEWHEATFISGVLLENILKDIHRKVLESTHLRKQEAVFSHPEKGMPKLRFDKMTLGQRLAVFKQYDLFALYEGITGEDVGLLKNLNWNVILATRNNSAHTQDIPVKEEDALLVSSALRLVALQITDWKPESRMSLWERIFQSTLFRKGAIVVAFMAIVILDFGI